MMETWLPDLRVWWYLREMSKKIPGANQYSLTAALMVHFGMDQNTAWKCVGQWYNSMQEQG